MFRDIPEPPSLCRCVRSKRGPVHHQRLCAFGIAQDVTIKPMRNLSVRIQSVRHLCLLRAVLDTELRAASVQFWFMMQTAVLCGFLTEACERVGRNPAIARHRNPAPIATLESVDGN